MGEPFIIDINSKSTNPVATMLLGKTGDVALVIVISALTDPSTKNKTVVT